MIWRLSVCLVTQLCLTLCDPVDYTPSGSFVYEDSPRILKWVAVLSSRGSSQPSHWTQVSCTASGFFFFFFFFFKCTAFYLFFILFFSLIFISWKLITLQYCSGFCHTLTWISHGFTCAPHPNLHSCLPIPSLWVFPVHQPWALVSYIQPELVICFTFDSILVSMLFSQNIPPSHSPTESKSLFCTFVSLFLFCI